MKLKEAIKTNKGKKNNENKISLIYLTKFIIKILII